MQKKTFLFPFMLFALGIQSGWSGFGEEFYIEHPAGKFLTCKIVPCGSTQLLRVETDDKKDSNSYALLALQKNKGASLTTLTLDGIPEGLLKGMGKRAPANSTQLELHWVLEEADFSTNVSRILGYEFQISSEKTGWVEENLEGQRHLFVKEGETKRSYSVTGEMMQDPQNLSTRITVDYSGAEKPVVYAPFKDFVPLKLSNGATTYWEGHAYNFANSAFWSWAQQRGSWSAFDNGPIPLPVNCFEWKATSILGVVEGTSNEVGAEVISICSKYKKGPQEIFAGMAPLNHNSPDGQKRGKTHFKTLSIKVPFSQGMSFFLGNGNPDVTSACRAYKKCSNPEQGGSAWNTFRDSIF